MKYNTCIKTVIAIFKWQMACLNKRAPGVILTNEYSYYYLFITLLVSVVWYYALVWKKYL